MKVLIVFILVMFSPSLEIFCQLNEVLIKSPFGNDKGIWTNARSSTWDQDDINHSINLFMNTGGIYFNKSPGWEEKNNYVSNVEQFCMAISGSNIFSGTTTGLYIGTYNSTTDEVSWKDAEHHNFGLTNISVYDIYIETDLWFACTDNGLYRSEDDGDNWYQDLDIDDDEVKQILKVGDDFFVAAESGVWKTEDDGDNWDQVLTDSYGAETLFYDSVDEVLCVGLKNDRYIKGTDNGGNTWSPIVDFVIPHYVSCITGDGDYLYIGTDDDGFYQYDKDGTPPNQLLSINGKLKLELTDPYPYFHDLEIIGGLLYAATGKDEYPTYTHGLGLCQLSIPATSMSNWTQKNVCEDEGATNERDSRSIYINDGDMWLVAYGVDLYPNATIVDSSYLGSPFWGPPFPMNSPYWGWYNCYGYAWHFTEGGITGTRFYEPDDVGYIKTDTYETNYDYILAGHVKEDNTLDTHSSLEIADLEKGNWDKMTQLDMMHTGIKSFLSNYPNVDLDEGQDLSDLDDIWIISKWSDKGPLVEHKLNDSPYAGNATRFWTSYKSISGIIDSDQWIGRKIITDKDKTTTIESGEDVEFYVAPMNGHAIVLNDGFHAEDGSNFHAYVKDDYSIPWEEYRLPPSKVGVQDDEIESLLNSKRIAEINIEISPIPTNNISRIIAKISDNVSNVPVKLVIYSFSGEIVKSLLVQNGVETNIDFRNLSSGTYMISAESEYKSEYGNLIKSAGAEIIIVER